MSYQSIFAIYQLIITDIYEWFVHNDCDDYIIIIIVIIIMMMMIIMTSDDDDIT